MAILNIFKNKKIKKEEKPTEVKKEEPVEIKPQQIKEKPKEGKVIGEPWRVLKAPQVTEKATDLAKENQYVFKVFPKANKTEIKKAIEDLYGVNVVGVEIIKVPPKRRRLGRILGWRKGYKKAIIKIKEGQKIEILPK